IPLGIALGLWLNWHPMLSLVIGLALFGILFALNSALHSYLIIAYSRADGVSLDVGFYYMANAGGRLLGTVLSGWLFLNFGLVVCLLVSALLLMGATLMMLSLPTEREQIKTAT